jgi:hypothetical protein
MAWNSGLEKQPGKIEYQKQIKRWKKPQADKHHSVSQPEVFSQNGDQRGLLLVSVLSLAIRQAEG